MSDENEHLHDVHERLLRMAAAGKSDLSNAGANEDEAGPPPALPELEGAFGTYELERPLGHGGQGVVYLANDTRLRRKVALKLLSASGAAGATARARFEREATAASRLHHAGICTVYEAGELDGQRFLAMEYVDGESLPQWIARTANSDAATDSGARRTRVDAALRLVEKIARAVHAAHEAGVIHRDLKPQNIMLRRDGSPVVLDFGLARDDRDDGDVLTMQGDVLGTPAYMPPERVRGTAGKAADAREDVYGLGAILYECLTGQRPFRGHTREQLYQRILTSQVQDPRMADAAIPREARFVVETAMEKVPDRRYASALKLADELKRLHQREPIQARPVPVWLRLQRWVQRHPTAAVPTIAAFLALLGGILVTALLLSQVQLEAGQTRVRALLAESSHELGRDPQRALLLAREATMQLGDDAPEALQTAVRSQLLEVLARTRRVCDLEHRGNARGVGISADGRRVATVFQGRDEPALKIWNVDEATAPIEFRIPGGGRGALVTSCAFDAGARILMTTAGGTTYVVSWQTGELLHELKPAAQPVPMIARRNLLRTAMPGDLAMFIPGRADLIATGSRDGIRVWQLRSGQAAGHEAWHDARPRQPGVSQIAVSADGALCAAGEHDGTIRLLRVADGELLGQAKELQNVSRMAFDPTRPFLVACGSTGESARIWAAATQAVSDWSSVGVIGRPGIRITDMHYDLSRRDAAASLVVTDNDRSMLIYRGVDVAPHYVLDVTIGDAASSYRALDISSDGQRILAGGIDGAAYLYDFRGRRQDSLRAGGDAVVAVAWSADGNRVVTLDQHGPARVWRAHDPVFRVTHMPRTVGRIAAAGERVVAGLHSGSIAVVPADSAKLNVAAGNVNVGAMSFALRADGRQLAVGSGIGLIDLWDLSGEAPVLDPRSAHLRSVLQGRNMWGDTLDLLDDGTLLVASPPAVTAVAPDGTVRDICPLPGQGSIARVAGRIVVSGSGLSYWDCEKKAEAAKGLLSHEGRSSYMTASADRQKLAAMDWNSGRINIVDVIGQRVRMTFVVPGVRSTALSSDGSQLMTAGMKGMAKLWDISADSPRVIAELRGHTGTVWGSSFGEGDRNLITCASDGTVRFWPSQFDSLDFLVEARLVREFNELERARYADLIDTSRHAPPPKSTNTESGNF